MSVARNLLEGKSREQLLELARAYHWWHAIDLGGLTTSGTRSPLIDAAFARIDFRDKKVLDIGCWDGLWSFEAEKGGAREVHSVDYLSLRSWSDQPSYELAHRLLGSKARYYPCLSVYDIERLGVTDFDVVLYCGIYYHLHDPLRALAAVRGVMKEGGRLLVEGSVIADADRAFATFHGRRWFRGDPTNWWMPSSACLREWLDCSFFDVASEISFNRDLAGAPPPPPLPGEHAEDRCALIATATSVSGRLARQVKRHAVPALPSSPGITKAAIAGLCAAASAFHQRQPWLRVPDVQTVKIELASMPTPVFAAVLGHGGLNRGLAIYYDQAIFTMTCQGSLFDELITWAGFFALVFVEGRELPAGEEQALREAGWTAGEYPYAVFCTGGTNEKDPGHTLRRPEAGELQLMEACLRAVPEFIEKHSAASEPAVEIVSVPISSGEVRLTLSRVAEGEREL